MLLWQGVTKPGDYQYIPNEGMPVYSTTSFGNLFVHYFISFPKRLTAEQKESIQGILGAVEWGELNPTN